MAIQTKWQETEFSVGDTISVHLKVIEGEKERIQIFKGVVISIKGHQENKSFVVRKIAVGQVGVERIWPLVCPSIKNIEVNRKGSVRRAKLYYLRKRKGKAALKVKELKRAKPATKKKKATIKTKKKSSKK